MKHRTFNSLMHYTNEKWAGQVLGMNINPSHGPDLIDENKIVEVKFKLVHPGKYTHVSWKALEHQMNYPREAGKPGYWALGTYELNKPISELVNRDREILESLVDKRELWVVSWEWMDQFKAYHQTGKTKSSEWDNTLRFAKKNKLPGVRCSYLISGGLVHFTKGVSPEKFGF